VIAPAAPASTLPSPGPGPFTALQILQSFQAADADGDGQLTRAEAQFLRLKPLSFEEMDRNKDGMLTRSEYESAF
jgi:Ca2+-binding EF-hand superfamily protein